MLLEPFSEVTETALRGSLSDQKYPTHFVKILSMTCFIFVSTKLLKMPHSIRNLKRNRNSNCLDSHYLKISSSDLTGRLTAGPVGRQENGWELRGDENIKRIVLDTGPVVENKGKSSSNYPNWIFSLLNEEKDLINEDRRGKCANNGCSRPSN